MTAKHKQELRAHLERMAALAAGLGEQPLFSCRCSDSEDACTATAQTAEGMRTHYRSVHHWAADLDTVRSTEMRYRELSAIGRSW